MIKAKFVVDADFDNDGQNVLTVTIYAPRSGGNDFLAISFD